MLLVVEVGHVVGIYAGELRLAVDHHEHRARPVASDAAQFDMARSAVAHAETYIPRWVTNRPGTSPDMADSSWVCPVASRSRAVMTDTV